MEFSGFYEVVFEANGEDEWMQEIMEKENKENNEDRPCFDELNNEKSCWDHVFSADSNSYSCRANVVETIDKEFPTDKTKTIQEKNEQFLSFTLIPDIDVVKCCPIRFVVAS